MGATCCAPLRAMALPSKRAASALSFESSILSIRGSGVEYHAHRAEPLLAVSCRVVGTRVHPQGRGDLWASCRCHRDAADAADAPPLANPRRFSPLIAPKLMCDTGSRRFLDHKSCNTSQSVRNTGLVRPPKLAMNSASISLFVLSVLTSPPLPLTKQRVLAPKRTQGACSVGPPFRPRGLPVVSWQKAG